MPTYEYECRSCGHRFERFQNMSDKPLKTCPKCAQGVRRLIGPGSGIILKGTASGRSAPSGLSCGRDRPCCGRDAPCDTKPCASSD
jgi:putative FmdB family regulatory protein